MNLLLTLPLALAAAAPPELVASTEKWHAERLNRLKSEDGWLTLVNLAWLEEGDNPAGSAEGLAVRLPASAPARVGTFVKQGQEVRFEPAPRVSPTLKGKAFAGGVVRSDTQGGPDVLRLGSLQLMVIDRGGRLGVRVRDAEAKTRKDFRGIERFAVSEAWRKVARFEPAPPGKTLAVPNVLGQVLPQPLAGTAHFSHEGKEHQLEAVLEDGELFFVFADLTNKKESYGAGRFLYAEPPQGKAKEVVLDFNRAYNPPCAFSPYATCPLPPKQNRLAVRVEAGELRYGEGH